MLYKGREKDPTLTFVVCQADQVLGLVTVKNTVEALKEAKVKAHARYGSDHLFLIAWEQATEEEREQACKNAGNVIRAYVTGKYELRFTLEDDNTIHFVSRNPKGRMDEYIGPDDKHYEIFREMFQRKARNNG